MKEAGYVYILTNPSFKEDWVKIGKSSRPVDIRSKELDNTAVPLPFEIYATLKTAKYDKAEKLIHHYIERFTNLRIRNNREFFNVSPEVALEIFKDVALLLDDAEIDEVFKDTVTGVSDNKKSSSRCTPHRDEVRVWMFPANSKFFNLDGCLEKYGAVYWAQYYHLQKGDIVYIYSSSPDSCVKYKLIVEEHDVQYGSHYDHEEEFFVDKTDFEKSKEHNRFVLLKFISETTSSRLSLAHLLEHGMNTAPRGALNLSHESFTDLLKYIEANF